LPIQHRDSFAAALALGAEAAAEAASIGQDREEADAGSAVTPSDLATLIYTSGTTGTPKGVMLTHANLVSNVKACVDHFEQGGEEKPIVGSADRSVAFLPWAHSYGQTCELHTGLAVGASTAVAAGAPGDAAELLGNIASERPTVLFSVPTLFKKLYDGVLKKVADEKSPVKRFLMQRGLDVGHEMRAHEEKGQTPSPWLRWQHKILDKAVLSKMRAPLGGRLRVACVAGAPTPAKVVRFIEALGVSMTEGYGLTETSPVVAITYPDPQKRVIGTVGAPLPQTQIKLVDTETLEAVDAAGSAGQEGELWVSGPQIMKGYWNKPEATSEVIVEDPDGKRWFRTGDLATLVEGKYIKITGRCKELYKLENGKYVAPAPIEDVMLLSPLVAQCVLYGSGRPHNVAIVVPNFAAVADEVGITDWYSPEQLCKDERVHNLIGESLRQQLNEHGIKKYEHPQAWVLIPEPFSAENEMLTPKLSVRKPNVIKAYKKQLDALYET